MVSSKRLGSEAPPSWSAKGRFTSTRFAFFATAELTTINDLANLRQIIGGLGGKALWKERAYLFGEEFRLYIENDLMVGPPHSDAKPLGAFTIGPRTK